MKAVQISVAMCTYNGGKYVWEQVQSIASQSRLPDEVVICDDGSSDDTISLLSTFADRSPFPVRIVSNDRRLGPTKNFEKAISLCIGDVIVLSDQDDIWCPQRLQKLAGALDQNPDAAYAFSNLEMISESGEPLGHTMWGVLGLQRNLDRFVGRNQLRLLLKQNVVTGASMAFRASFRDFILPIPSGWMHDYWIAVLGSALSRGIPIPEPLLMYRRHAGQACGLREKEFRQAVSESIAADELVLVGKIEQFREVQRRIDSVRPLAECERDRFELLRQKEAHLVKRAALRSLGGFRRIAAILAEALTGRYQLYSASWLSIARDLSNGVTREPLS
jgi:glycosyltransferase involved in cell wall biosynthesis